MRRRIFPSGPQRVVGLDLSLRAAAACAIPLDWNGSVSLVRTAFEGFPLTREASARDRIERISKLVDFVRRFCINARAEQVFVEEYAFHAASGSLADLGELGGAVKLTLFAELDFVVTPIVAASARKTLLQRVPRLDRGKTKPFVVQNVKRLGGQTVDWTHDECDAFVIANHGLGLLGGIPVSFPPE